jgi:hypothetical protein
MPEFSKVGYFLRNFNYIIYMFHLMIINFESDFYFISIIVKKFSKFIKYIILIFHTTMVVKNII